nr:pentatricopeptide repeat protein AaPPR5 [Agave angustifolia]
MLLSSSLIISHLHLPSPHFYSLTKLPTEQRKSHEKTQKITANLEVFAPKTAKSSAFQSPLQNPDDNLSESIPSHSFDPRSISSHLKSCTSLQEVKCVHAVAVRAQQSSVTYVGNNLISGYLRFSALDHARKLFDEMPERNIVTWTTILNGYHKLGLDEEVVEVFEGLIESSVQANSLTFVCLLKSCGNRFDFELGRQVHACVLKGSWSNLIVDSALIYFYAQCGDLLSASCAFDRMPRRDVVSWTTMITSYAQHGHSDEALAMFSVMQHQGLRPNEFTVCSVLKACGEERAVRFGRQLHGAIAKGMFEEDVVVGSSLVTMYAKCGEVSDARLVFDLMPKRNTITWTSMISGYAQNGLGEEAILLFHWMKRLHVSANNQTIVSILSACGSIRSVSLGKEVHGRILKKLAQSNTYIDSTLIWFYCKCGEFSYAARVLESMPERDVISWTAMISGHNSLDDTSDSLKFLNEMLWEGVNPTPYTYSSALKACAKGEEVRYGKWIHGSANKTRAMSNVFVGSALVDMYMRCGYVKDAFRVFETMPERNFVSWKAMIIGYAKNGHCREALQLMYQMQAEGFHVEDFVLSIVLSSCGDLQWEFDRSSAACYLPS